MTELQIKNIEMITRNKHITIPPKGIKISQMAEKTVLTGTEFLPYQEEATNGKISTETLKNYIIDDIDLSDIDLSETIETVEALRELIESTIQSIEDLKTEIDEKFDAKSEELDADLEEFKNSINDALTQLRNDMEDADEEINARIDILMYPLSAAMSASTTLYEYTGSSQTMSVTYSVTNGNDLTATDSTVITVNGTLILSDTSVSGTVSTSLTSAGTYTFTITAKYGTLTATASTTTRIVVPMYFGFASASSASDLSITSLTKQSLKTSPSGTYTLTNSTSGYYLWLCVPSTMTINGVTMGGFEVPMEDYESASTSVASYKCYRSANALLAGDFPIVIN